MPGRPLSRAAPSWRPAAWWSCSTPCTAGGAACPRRNWGSPAGWPPSPAGPSLTPTEQPSPPARAVWFRGPIARPPPRHALPTATAQCAPRAAFLPQGVPPRAVPPVHPAHLDLHELVRPADHRPTTPRRPRSVGRLEADGEPGRAADHFDVGRLDGAEPESGVGGRGQHGGGVDAALGLGTVEAS